MPQSETHDQAIAQRQRELIQSARVDAARLREPGETGPGRPFQSDLRVAEEKDALSLAGPPPDSFTGYQIIGELHRGGQGIVYEALQKSTRRKVAIKVMKEGPFASTVDKARFDREVQVLGQLRHSAIVAVHGTGVAAGHFYFVMDYVHGQPLDVYVAGGQRSVDEIVCLFAKVSEAVNAAHLRGIIHRDLKPTNVRVDDDGEPHVLDFGLAKAAASESEATAVTATGQFVGSLPWASPEQAAGAHAQVDVRTDVYSLGVMMFQMLTGRFPYEVVGTLRDVLDSIMHAEPSRPRLLRPQLNDELETILLKCLAKDRDLRYQTAGELARDLRRYLAGDPIEAKRESTIYVLRKQLRKHRISVALSLVFAGTIAAGLVASVAGWRSAAAQRDVAVLARDEANAVTDFLKEMLSEPNAYLSGERETTVRGVVDRASQRLDTAFPDQPLVQAAIHSMLASTYEALALFEPARRHFEAALRLRRLHLPPDSLEIATTLSDFAKVPATPGPLGEKLARESLAIRRSQFGSRHPDVAQSLSALGLALYRQGRLAEAEASLEEALEQHAEFLGEADRETILIGRVLAVVIRDQGRYAEAEPIFRKNLDLWVGERGEKNADVANIMAELGEVLHFLGRDEEADQLQARALDIRRELWGDEHHTVANSLSNLGVLKADRGAYAEAESLFRESLELRIRLEGAESISVTYPLVGLGRVYLKQQRLDEAQSHLRQAIAILEKEAPGHWRIAYARGLLGACLTAAGRHAEAGTMLAEALAGLRNCKSDSDVFVQEVRGFIEDLDQAVTE